MTEAGSNAEPGTRSRPLEIDLNESPLPSPREFLAADLPVRQAAGRGVRSFDINASPPREVDVEGEGFVEQSYGGGQGLVTVAAHNADKMRIVSGIPLFGRSLNAPETTSNMLYRENGFSLLNASRGLLPIQSSFEDKVQQRLHRPLKGVDFSSPLNGGIWPTNATSQNFSTQHQHEVYLKALRDYIHAKRGILGDGWLVEFVYCKRRCKTFPVYRAPDGSRFESMLDVAGHLGLLTNYRSLETEERSDGIASLQKRLHLDGRRKEFLRSSRPNNYRQNPNILTSSSVVGISSGSRIMGQEFDSYRKSNVEADFKEHGRRGFELCQDVCPLQFEDLVVLSLGMVDPRPTYHSNNQIWPVGFRSCWHDKITGSLFVFEVVDGGDVGPSFKVKRYPCSTQPIPIGTTVLLRQKYDSRNGGEKEQTDDSTASRMDDEESIHIKMMLTEDCPPLMEDVLFREVNISTTESSCFPKSSINVIPDDLEWVDCIGVFVVEGRSCSIVWDMATQTLLRAFHEVYKQAGILKFFCKHNVIEVEVKAVESNDSLSKFCHLSGPSDIPHLVQSKSDFDSCLEMIAKWLKQDRFGLDTEFVQEILEQLPGIHVCLDYKFLSERCQNSSSQTVRSGFLLVKRKKDVEGGKGADGFLSSCKRKQFVEESEIKKSFPSGEQLSSKLPTCLIGDVVQAWEFLWRFSEVIGLEGTFSFQELENELMNPWLDSINPLEGSGNGTQIYGDFTLCTGAALTQAHSSLLKVLVRELLLKVAGYVDPNSDAGEGKSRRGRKKDADNLFASKKMKLDMLQINELTWPELARRYILVFLSMEGNLDSGEIIYRESSKIFHCLRGDGGTLCGSLTGVAGMEADARFLAEASLKVFGSVKKSDFVNMSQDKPDTVGSPKLNTESDNEVPEWVLALEPARKLPTNVGARIRNCVYDALNKNPPEWAKQILLHSISKEVYKGNASGPTKRAIVSVLAEANHKDLQPKPEKKEKEKGKSVSTLSDFIMKQCRIVLRRIIAEDEERVFCNLLGRTLLNHNDNDDEGLLGYPAMVSRPLDFRIIDIRLAGGAYGGSHEAFHDDVLEVWNILRTAYADQSDVVDLAESLSHKFDVMYDKEVLTMAKKFTENGSSLCIGDEAQKEIDEILMHANESLIPKAPWDEGVCKVCGIDKDDDNVLLCDTCDSEYHTYCLCPPLTRIPEGNWYCPSCVAGQSKSKGLCHGTQLKWHRKKRYQGDFTRTFMETLSRLARTMGSKEYWDFSVEERTFLIKFFCDETLSTSIIRDHLDHCACTSADLQQKLRSLSAELKNLKLKEEILAASMEKANAVDNRAGALAPDVLSYVVNKDGKPLGKMPNRGNSVSLHPEDGLALSKNDSEQHHVSCRKEISSKSSLVAACQVPQGHISSDGIRINVTENTPVVAVNSESMLNGHRSSFPSAERALQDGNQEMDSLKHEISVLRDSIARLEYELRKVSTRKECLGRDSDGRIYWGFERSDSAPLMVNGSMENPLSSRGPKVSWVSYQSDAEIGQIVEWLREGDATERELKESILQWQRNKQKDFQNAENPVQKEKQPSFLVTKAVTALEKKYGPGLQSQPLEVSQKRVQKCNMYRCECLEPIWSSKHHCASCHRTYSSSDELERHSDGKCSGISVITKTKKISEDLCKGKKVAAETSVKMHPSNSGNCKPPRGEKEEIGFNSTKFQEPGCPYDFEEIKSKFVPQNSLKDLVKDVGLIRYCGNPSLVSSASPFVHDPTLRLDPTNKNEAGAGNESVQGTKIDGDTESFFDNFPTYVGNERDAASKLESLVPPYTNEGYLLSGNKRKSACIIPESSLRRLVGRVTQILRQLKINLLDMDAALSEEALRPSMAHLEKRFAWRTFVKSASSIYEMVQATVLLENMIKADYLKKDWWYWSSLSSAATISTLSALALRVYTLDAAIVFEPSSPPSDSTEIPKPGEPEGEGTTPKLDTPNDTILKTSNHQTENSKPKSRSSKRKKDSAG